MTDIDSMIAVLQAAKEGKTIQLHDDDCWFDLNHPTFNFEMCKYRVKPEPVVGRVQVAITKNGDFIYTPQNPNLELTFEDGKLTRENRNERTHERAVDLPNA